MRDPVTHIERSRLPWHSERVTECGLDVTRVQTWTRDEAIAKARELGRQRFSLFACMTCTGTVERHRTWEDDPVSCMERHCGKWSYRHEEDGYRKFSAELRAIATLIDNHRGEFDAIVAALLEAPALDARRLARRRRLGGGR